MTSADIAYARLCCAVFCAGIKLWQDHADAWLARFDVTRDPSPKPEGSRA